MKDVKVVSLRKIFCFFVGVFFSGYLKFFNRVDPRGAGQEASKVLFLPGACRLPLRERHGELFASKDEASATGDSAELGEVD